MRRMSSSLSLSSLPSISPLRERNKQVRTFFFLQMSPTKIRTPPKKRTISGTARRNESLNELLSRSSRPQHAPFPPSLLPPSPPRSLVLFSQKPSIVTHKLSALSSSSPPEFPPCPPGSPLEGCPRYRSSLKITCQSWFLIRRVW